MSHIHLELPRNSKGRDFIVGDLHGVYDLLDQALETVRFDTQCDRLFSVGDLMDRGPYSARALVFLQKPWFFAVAGNHEAMFVEVVDEDGIFQPHVLSPELQKVYG